MLGQRIREARKRKGYTQADVARMLGIDFTTLSKYENNRSEPDNETLRKLADILGVSVDYLLGRTKYPNAQTDIELPQTQLEFVRFIASHIDEAFFEEFDGSEEEMKEALMENLMFGWEQIKKYMERRQRRARNDNGGDE